MSSIVLTHLAAVEKREWSGDKASDALHLNLALGQAIDALGLATSEILIVFQHWVEYGERCILNTLGGV